MKKILVCVALAALGTTAMADTGMYVGGDLSSTKFKFPGDSEHKTGLGAHFGYALNENIAFEATVRNMGHWNINGTKYSVNSINASALFKAPMGDFALFGRVGYARNSLDWTHGSYSASQHRNKALFGVGGEYKVAKQVTLRAEYVNLGSNKIGEGSDSLDVKMAQFNFGASYHF